MSNENIVPPQISGKSIEAGHLRHFDDAAQARAFYRIAIKRLQDVNQWNALTGDAFANFQLFDLHGRQVERTVKEGDYLRIDIPGPGSMEGEHYDWARVEEVTPNNQDDHDVFGFRVRPSRNPTHQSDDTAHFYSDAATSTFIVKRYDAVLTCNIYDRNTQSNDDATRVTDKIRNVVVAAGGMLTFSRIQWERLAKVIIED